MSLMVVLMLSFCLWLCLWILPAILWVLVRHMDRHGQDATAMSLEERIIAENRSAELLRDLLDEGEYQQLLQQGYLDVPSPGHVGRLYRIPHCYGRVCILEGGRSVAELCVQPVAALPANDMIALHKLMIEGNEQDYLARARELPIAAPSDIVAS